MKVKAANEFVIVEVAQFDGENKTEGGLYLPGKPEEDFKHGKVLSVGKEADADFSDKTVVFGKFAGIQLNDTTVALTSKEVIGTVE